jgi:hypothetical protein
MPITPIPIPLRLTMPETAAFLSRMPAERARAFAATLARMPARTPEHALAACLLRRFAGARG